MEIVKIILSVIHVFISALLVVVILLQSSKGGGLSGTFGGQASTALFGARGTANVLTRLTQYLGAGFLLLSIVLSLLAGRGYVVESVTQRVIATAPGAQLPSVEDLEYTPGQAPGPASETGGNAGDEGGGDNSEQP